MFVNKYCLPNKMHCVIAPLNGVGGIYLGDIDAAQDPDLLERNQIKAIISVLDQSINIRGGIQKLWIMAEDSDDYPLHRYFDMSYKFIETQSQRTNILIHCYAGISRSTTLLAAYLMRKYGWNSQKSVSHIQSRRRVACPNQGFMRQLQDLELKIFPENRPISKSSSMHQIKPREYGSVRMVDNDRFTEFNRKLEDFRHQMKKKQRLVC